MTTAHTFQGISSDSRPTSRVLNPPGGSSSNIFGCENQLKQQSSVRNIPENVGAERNDNISHGDLTASTGPDHQPLAPKIGGDSIQNPSGIYPSSGCDKAPSKIKIVSPFSVAQSLNTKSVGRKPSRSKYCNADTFRNIFGEGIAQHRQRLFRRVRNVTADDSFSRVFGQKSLIDYKDNMKVGSVPSALQVNGVRPERRSFKSGDAADLLIYSNNSYCAGAASKAGKVEDKYKPLSHTINNAGSHTKPIPYSRRFAPISAFNPITGEPYNQPKQQPPMPVNVPAESTTSKSTIDSSSSTDGSQPSTFSFALDEPQPALAPMSPSQLKQQNLSSGQIGGSTGGSKERRSTRVSQPPGGHATKLW